MDDYFFIGFSVTLFAAFLIYKKTGLVKKNFKFIYFLLSIIVSVLIGVSLLLLKINS